jgi:pyruvate kinase
MKAVNKKTKIICTLGPVTDDKEVLKKLVLEGMNIARLNFSHGTYEEHERRIQLIREVSKELKTPIGILLDTKGPEIRVGHFENHGVNFEAGDEVTIVPEEILGTREKFTLRCPEVFSDVKKGDYILMDDGKMRVDIVDVIPGEQIKGVVANPHYLKSTKGCNLPGIVLSMPFISEKDEADIRFGCKMGVDYIAASFTRRRDDVLAIKKILIGEDAVDIQVIPKIENQEGFDNLRDILEVSDGVMVARGDLGVDVQLQYVPIYQKQIIAIANEMGKPVITATHMLESMMANPRPTRAEASDVANAIMDGTDSIMLSAESAVGQYPVESVQTMTTIAKAIEPMIPYRERLNNAISSSKRTMADAIAISAADTALTMDIKAIIAFTENGSTAKRLAKFRPIAPIIAVCFNHKTERSLLDVFGVQPYVSTVKNTAENDEKLAKNVALDLGLKPDDNILVVAGYPVGSGNTNMVKIVTI